VLIVAPSLDMIGGQSLNADRLRRRLQEVANLDVAFVPVNPRLPGPLRLLQQVKYVRTVVTSFAYGALLLRAVPRADIVHAFSASYWSFLLAPVPAMLLARLLGKRTVLNYRSGEAADHLARWRTAHWGAKLAHAIVVPSGYLEKVFRDQGFHAQVIANFLEDGVIHFRERESLRPRFFANRHFEPLYNVSCVVRAFARIQREHPDASLVLAGDGSQRAELEALVRSQGVRNVQFIGKVAPSEMPALYDAADIYLNAPDIDNMPGSVIECFAAGLPVVSTDAGGIPFIVTDGSTGLLVPRGDHEALALAAMRLLAEPGLGARLARAAHEEALRRYVWPSVRESWVELYQGLHVSGSPGAPCPSDVRNG
jgi:glycosyltransferase involved in cell wall biosynthesis